MNINALDNSISDSTVAVSTFSTPGKHALPGVRHALVGLIQVMRPLMLCATLIAATMSSTADANEPGPVAPTATAASQPAAPSSHSACAQRAEFWLDLSEPALSSIGYDRPAERAALMARIDHQQDEVLARVRELGGEELARVKEVRNAVAVRLKAQAVSQARQIPGVLRVRPVQHRNRIGD